jgi:hypothetical protein
MKHLIRVGFYRELKHGKPDGESLHAVVQQKGGPDDAQLVHYLRAGSTLVASPSMVRDVLANNAMIGSLEIRTDGTYAWPSDLAHYVERHHARVPEDFLQHVRSLSFTVPPNINVAQLELG